MKNLQYLEPAVGLVLGFVGLKMVRALWSKYWSNTGQTGPVKPRAVGVVLGLTMVHAKHKSNAGQILVNNWSNTGQKLAKHWSNTVYQ